VSETPAQTAKRRPVLVAIIFWLHALGVFAIAWIFFRMVTGNTRLRTPTVFYASAALILAAVKMWAAAALYYLRRSAVSIFLVAVLLNLPLTMYDVYRHPRGYPPSGILSMAAGVLIAAGVCLYSLHLARIGTLH